MQSTALTQYRSTYVAKKAFFNFLGNAFRLYSPDGSLAFFVKQKAFKLKEQITVFADEGQQDAMLGIQARSVLDFSAVYDITDAKSQEKVGALQRQGVKSLFRDEWSILDAQDNVLGSVKEDSGLLALIRRFLVQIIPQTFRVQVEGHEVALIKQRFNPFQLGYDVDFSNAEGKLDPRMYVAIVVLLLAIEGRQN
ncbi:MAG TPA: hypothetical protein DFR83_02735 [Deltaproteobacteria bacterium]|nr:hypothetical protein [Deltaproteobacteria bacterium]